MLTPCDQNTLFAALRTRLSAERTMMSWIRTSFSMISFGFTIIKFFQYLHADTTKAVVSKSSLHLGLFLICLGVGSLIPAIIQHYYELKNISTIDNGSRWSLTFVVAVLVGIIGLYALINVISKNFFM